MRDGRDKRDAEGPARVEAEERRAERSALAKEGRRITVDPEDERERRAVLHDMDAISADWPE